MNILIVSDKYWPKPLANAICAQNVAEDLVKKGHTVDLLVHRESSYELPKSKNGVNVIGFRPDLRYRLFYFSRSNPKSRSGSISRILGSMISHVKKLLFLWFWPMDSVSFPRRVFRIIEKYYKKSAYDAVVTVFGPISGTLAGYWFKKHHPECTWIIYALDNFENSRQIYLPNSLRWAHYWLPRFLNRTDMLICMKTRFEWFQTKRQALHDLNKVKIADIPLLKRQNAVLNNSNKKQISPSRIIKWVYAGTLAPPNYRIEDLVKVFNRCSDASPRELHIYSSGKEYELLRRKACFPKNVYLHDYIAHEKLEQIYADANVLVSLKYSDQISAKMFEYMSYGKPILHFSGSAEDPDSEYISTYERGFVVDTLNLNLTATSLQVIEWEKKVFFEEKNNKPPNLSIFDMNTPCFTSDLILSAVNKGSIK